MGKLDLVTIIIIAANVIISYKGFSDYSFFDKYKFQVGGVRRGEQIRMVSSGFLHADTQHLLFNMLSLYFFADVVITLLSPIQFLFVYFGSLLVGSLLSLYFHKNEYHYSAVGASGAVSGIIYSAILLQPGMNLYMFFIPIPIPAYIFGIGYLLYSIYGMKNQIGNIGHSAHLGGAMGGYTTAKKEVIEILRQRSRPYLFSNSLAPSIVGASLKVFELLEKDTSLRDQLEWNTNYFKAGLRKSGIDFIDGDSAIVPVMLYDAKLAQLMAEELLKKGIYVIGFFFPVVPKDKARIRVQISAAHTQDHLDKAIEAFTDVAEKIGIIKKIKINE